MFARSNFVQDLTELQPTRHFNVDAWFAPVCLGGIIEIVNIVALLVKGALDFERHLS